MISQTKGSKPGVLCENWKEWTRDVEHDPNSEHKKSKYRHPDIKMALTQEVSNKCVYCESKIGDTCPGDVEHIVPTSKRPIGRFLWGNLTIACNECNRRKSDYYDKELGFLNPYIDDVESFVIHRGPIVGWKPGVERAELTVKKLEMHDKTRWELVSRKIEHIEHLNDVMHRTQTGSGVTQELARQKISNMCRRSEKYSAMVRSIVHASGIQD